MHAQQHVAFPQRRARREGGLRLTERIAVETVQIVGQLARVDRIAGSQRDPGAHIGGLRVRDALDRHVARAELDHAHLQHAPVDFLFRRGQGDEWIVQVAVILRDGGLDFGDQLARQGLAQKRPQARGDVGPRLVRAQPVHLADRDAGRGAVMRGFDRPQQHDRAQGRANRRGVLIVRHGVGGDQRPGRDLRGFRQVAFDGLGVRLNRRLRGGQQQRGQAEGGPAEGLDRGHD